MRIFIRTTGFWGLDGGACAAEASSTDFVRLKPHLPEQNRGRGGEMDAVQAMRHILGKEQRDEVTKAITAILFERKEIVFAFVHGSFLSGSVFRDIDIGIFVDGIDRADFWDYEVEIALKIEEALSRRFLVEPKVINTAPLSFCYHVIRGQLLFSRDEDLLVEFMVRVARGYLEMAPIRHRYIAEAMG